MACAGDLQLARNRNRLDLQGTNRSLMRMLFILYRLVCLVFAIPVLE